MSDVSREVTFEAAAASSVLSQHPVTVLLVDDQPMIGEAVRRMLASQSDIVFKYCQDPTNAMRLAEELKPTVILQDLVMPQMDGLTLVKFFRANPETRLVPMIVLSTKEDPKTKAEAFGVGANDYLVKLPDALELIARIRYHSQGYINLLQRNEAFSKLHSTLKEVEKRNHFIKEVFGRYLSDEIVETLVEKPEGLSLGGEKRKVSIMMTDLRGFTSMSEKLAPEQVVSVINTFLGIMTDIIVKHQGTIDEFIGDAILVIFGAPIQRPDDALRCVACAVEMQLAMEEVNRVNGAAGMPAVEMGIGLNTGEVVVGNIGSAKRAKYGVVGSQVNLTSRIEGYTTGGQILISERTKNEAGGDVVINDSMEVMPKGVKNAITIYSVAGVKGKYDLELKLAKVELVALGKPLPIKFVVAEGKDTSGTVFQGTIAGLSAKEAEIVSSERPAPLSNLKMQIFSPGGDLISDEVYAKVATHSDTGTFVIRFTSVPKDVEKFLTETRGG